MNPSHRRRILENLPKNWNWHAEMRDWCALEEVWDDRDPRRRNRPEQISRASTGLFIDSIDTVTADYLCQHGREGPAQEVRAARSASSIPPSWRRIKGEGDMNGRLVVTGTWTQVLIKLSRPCGFYLKWVFCENSPSVRGVHWRTALTIHHHPSCCVLSFTLLLSIPLLRL